MIRFKGDFLVVLKLLIEFWALCLEDTVMINLLDSPFYNQEKWVEDFYNFLNKSFFINFLFMVHSITDVSHSLPPFSCPQDF